MDQKLRDYLFDLQGYLVLEKAIAPSDLAIINQWIDDHWEYVENPWTTEEDKGCGTDSVGSAISKHIHTIWRMAAIFKTSLREEQFSRG